MKCPLCKGWGRVFPSMMSTASLIEANLPLCQMCEGKMELTDEEFAKKSNLMIIDEQQKQRNIIEEQSRILKLIYESKYERIKR